MTCPIKITLKDDVVLYCTPVPRRIPFPLLHNVKNDLSPVRNPGLTLQYSKPSTSLQSKFHTETIDVHSVFQMLYWLY